VQERERCEKRVRQERHRISGMKRQTDIQNMEDIDGPEGIRKTEGNIQGIGQT
jgi:hypothetical protein